MPLADVGSRDDLIGPRRQVGKRADFGDVPHAALVAYLGGSPRYVGHAAEFQVAKAGRLLLGVNDRDVSNNSGFYDVVVEVNPPDALSARSRTPGYVPPAWR